MMLEEAGMMAWACVGVAAARPLPAASGESAEYPPAAAPGSPKCGSVEAHRSVGECRSVA